MYFETYFNGNQTLTMTSYYGTYRFVAYTSMYASTQYTFTSSWTDGNAPQTTTYRAETTGDYFTPLLKKLYEGVNKGTYESSKNNMLTLFNNNAAAEPRYLSWELNNGQFSLVEPFAASVSTDQNYYLYTAAVSPAGTNYTYNWKIGNTVTNNGNATINVGFDYNNDRESSLVVKDANNNIRAVRFTVPKAVFELVIDYNQSANSITGRWNGNGQYDTTRNDYNLYTWKWYSAELGDDYVELVDERTYAPVNSKLDYKLVGTLISNN